MAAREYDGDALLLGVGHIGLIDGRSDVLYGCGDGDKVVKRSGLCFVDGDENAFPLADFSAFQTFGDCIA